MLAADILGTEHEAVLAALKGWLSLHSAQVNEDSNQPVLVWPSVAPRAEDASVFRLVTLCLESFMLQHADSFDMVQALDSRRSRRSRGSWEMHTGTADAMALPCSASCKTCPSHPQDQAAPILCHWCALLTLAQTQRAVKQLQVDKTDVRAQNAKLVKKVKEQDDVLKMYNKAHNKLAKKVVCLSGLAQRIEEICPNLFDPNKDKMQASKNT